MLEGKTLRNGTVFKHLTTVERNKERKCLYSEAQFQRFYRQTAKKKKKTSLIKININISWRGKIKHEHEHAIYSTEED